MRAGAGLGPPEALPHPLGVPLPRGVSPYRCLRVHLGALLQQPLHHAQVPISGSVMERRPVELVGRRGVGAMGGDGGVRVRGEGRGSGGEWGGRGVAGGPRGEGREASGQNPPPPVGANKRERP